MKNTLFIHVGQPKTGTTAIQRAFSKYSDENSSPKVYFPTSGRYRRKVNGHHNLAYELHNPKAFKENFGSWNDLSDELKLVTCDRVLLSSEAFRRFLANITRAKVKKVLPEWDVRIIIFLRPQWNYIESGYNQLLRFGRADVGMNGFYEQQRGKIIDYRAIVEAWTKQFGSDAVICLPYDAQTRKAGVVDAFIKRGLKIDLEIHEENRENTKFGLLALSGVKEFKRQFKLKFGNDLDAMTVNKVGKISRYFNEIPEESSNYSLMSPKLREQVFKDSLEFNKWIAERYPDFNSDEFLSPPSNDNLNYVSRLPRLSKEHKIFIKSLLEES